MRNSDISPTFGEVEFQAGESTKELIFSVRSDIVSTKYDATRDWRLVRRVTTFI